MGLVFARLARAAPGSGAGVCTLGKGCSWKQVPVSPVVSQCTRRGTEGSRGAGDIDEPMLLLREEERQKTASQPFTLAWTFRTKSG